MLNTLNINLKTDIKNDRATALGIKLMSQDKNNNQFILRFTNGGEPVTLDDTYTVEILTKFTKSGTSRLTTAKVRQDYATLEFDTAYITQDETVYNYVYVRKSGSLVVSADANAFYFDVGLSEIDKDAGRVAEVYDENYQKYLDEFKEVADFTAIQQAEADRESAETTRKTNETTRISNEDARKSAEVIRLANEVDRVNAENVRAEFYEGFDGEIATLKTEVAKKANQKQEDWITPTLLNGWYAIRPNEPPQYMMDEFGFVHFRGCVSKGASATSNVAFKLPTGYLPNATTSFSISEVAVSPRSTAVSISVSGNVDFAGALSNSWYAISYITFKAV